ncbi:MAG: hypothetical protein JO300_11715 [Silvibacterium sp.]|nr:hypothetical protein [Silvibacterium sp.]MBV8629564.1 hypothetical protein [Silvibacterium sp.]
MTGASGDSRFRWYIFLAAFLILPNVPLLQAAVPSACWRAVTLISTT